MAKTGSNKNTKDKFFRTKPNQSKSDGFFNNTKKDNFFKTKPNQPKTNETEGFFVTKKTTKNRENRMAPSTSGHNSNNSLVDRKKTTKKPFDKKRWRLQKYSKKYKLEQWEDKRKKTILREYYKDLKNDNNGFDVTKIYAAAEQEENQQNDNNINTNSTQINQELIDKNNDANDNINNEKLMVNNKQKSKSKAFKKAQSEFERIKEERKRKREEFQRKKAEKDEALKQYKTKKLEKFKKLNRKTKKGQPIMKDRMELLLEKIQQSV